MEIWHGLPRGKKDSRGTANAFCTLNVSLTGESIADAGSSPVGRFPDFGAARPRDTHLLGEQDGEHHARHSGARE